MEDSNQKYHETNIQLSYKSEDKFKKQDKIKIDEIKYDEKSSNREKMERETPKEVKSTLSKNRILFLIIILIVICIIGTAAYLIYKFLKKKEVKSIDNNIEKEKKEHYFTAIYKSQNGKNIKIFNPSRVGLNEGEYFIYELSGESNLRRIEENDEINGSLNSTKNGLIKIKVNFSNPLTNMDFMFEGCEDLINVNLSEISSPSINSMIYTFTNCRNLQQVDFSSLDTSNVTSMDFLFAGCNNLFELINFENLNASSVTKTAGMFSNCTSLMAANLSGFDLDNVEEQSGMFINNTYLKIVDIGNNCTNLNEIFSTQSFFNVTIVGNYDDININNILNESNFNGFFSKSYRYEIEKQYNYLPMDCIIGEGELCRECNDSIKTFCKKCNKGYFLPTGINLIKCLPCPEGCNDCISNNLSESIICISCNDGYKIFNGECIEDCKIGEKEKCKDCKIENGTNDQCLNCNEGYYLDVNSNKKKCKKIDIENCINAIFDSNNLTCVNCSLGYEVINGQCNESCEVGENEKCASCNRNLDLIKYCGSCNSGYYLDNKIEQTKCQLCEDVYDHCQECEIINGNLTCYKCKKGYQLINNTCFKNCDENCLNCYFDGINKGKCLQCKDRYFLKNNYTRNGNIYINDPFCSECPLGCFECLDYYIGYELISINCINCLPGYKLNNFTCEKQCDIGENNLCLNCDDNRKNYCSECNPSYYLKNGICNSCEVENCIKCNKTGKCYECIKQYQILNGQCFKTCEKGDNEKCLECDNTPLKITQNCSRCNKGYFLPDDSQDKTKCFPCELGCNNCSGKMNNSFCSLCEENFLLSNGKCNKKCLLGLEELCLTCDLGDKSQNCGSCNEGYYLPNNLSERRSCHKCGKNMIQCHQDEDNNIIPDKCISPYIPSGKYCLEKCQTDYNTYCSSCSKIPGEINLCEICYSGYYIPTDSNKTYCLYCGTGCKLCNGTTKNKKCYECWSDYKLYEGKCIRNCYINYYGDYCTSCNPEPGKNDRCLTCYEGYYLPTYSTDRYNKNRYCSKCPIYCKKCSGDLGREICNECLSDKYNLINGKCIKNCNYFISITHCNKNNCYESESSITFANCTKCDDGYYLPKIRKFDENYNVCYKCSIPGCIKCEGDSNKTNICLKCNNTNPLIVDNKIISCYQGCQIGEGSKCKSCQNGTDKCGECNEKYTLLNNKCISEYNIYAKYKTTKKNETVKLMNYNEIFKLEINDTIIQYPTNYFIFENPGVHTVYIKLKSIDVFSHLFTDIINLIYIEFSDNFDSSKITLMNDCFSGCINLEYVDMSRLNLENNHCFMNFFKNNKNLEEVKFPEKDFHNIHWFYGMFYGCEKLKYIDMSRVFNDNAEYFYDMFRGCKSLEILVLPDFDKECPFCSKEDMFLGVPKNATIAINKNFYKSIEYQLKEYDYSFGY